MCKTTNSSRKFWCTRWLSRSLTEAEVFVDVRQIGKPDILRCTREQTLKEWPVMCIHVCDVVLESGHQGEEARCWATSQVVVFGNAEITAKSTTSGWTALTMDQCRVTSADGGQRMHAWRRLCKECERSTEQSNFRLLKRVLQPKQQS